MVWFWWWGQAAAEKIHGDCIVLDYRNKTGSGHIVTIEDQLNMFMSTKCIFTQREVGIDTLSWTEALKVTNQRPDAIYIGEIRDKD